VAEEGTGQWPDTSTISGLTAIKAVALALTPLDHLLNLAAVIALSARISCNDRFE